MRRHLPALIAVVLAALSVAAPSRAQAADAEMFGVNAQRTLDVAHRAEAQPHLAAMADIGVGVVRKDAFWSDAEPVAPVNGQHRYTWERHDQLVTMLAHAGLRWYPILDYSTAWAGSVPGPRRWMSPPSEPAYFAAYARAFAERYGRGGAFWEQHPGLPQLPVETYEVWNEPNVEHFWPDQRTAGRRYAELLSLTETALHAVDPSARVVVGGLGIVGMERFLSDMLGAVPGLRDRIDAVGFHPYGASTSVTYGRMAEARRIVDRLFRRPVPLEVTEFGVAVPFNSEVSRAAHVERVTRELAHSDCGVSRIIVHTWTTDEQDPADPEDWFGIANLDGTLKPTAERFAAAVRAARRPAPSSSPVAICRPRSTAPASPATVRAETPVPIPLRAPAMQVPAAPRAATPPASKAAPRTRQATARRARIHSARARFDRRSRRLRVTFRCTSRCQASVVAKVGRTRRSVRARGGRAIRSATLTVRRGTAPPKTVRIQERRGRGTAATVIRVRKA